jgi:hypothetical protein
MKLLARRMLVFLAWCPLLLTTTGCANQVEGDRCDRDNLNADCEEGLICKQVYVTGNYHYICCPVPPAPVSAAACNASGVPPVDAAVPDAQTGVESGADSDARDAATNDAVREAADDRSTVDARTDISADLGVDMSTRDVPSEGAAGDAQDARSDASTIDQTPADGADDRSSTDAPSPDAPPDAAPDTAGDAAFDAPALDVDVMTPIDVMPPIDVDDAADAPSADGPG